MPDQEKIDKIIKGKPFSLIDLIAITIALVLAGSFVVYSCAAKEEGAWVRITQSKIKRTDNYSLNKDARIEIESGGGVVIVVIDGTNKTVSVESSPCHDKLCMRRGAIRYAGDSIVCAPEEIFIKITGKVEWYPIG